ncbi:rhodanese-like domain-containing protein [Tropicimonas isoalkanivorans]|uniref:Rhodanese-related sulfurtransferase n=1 Tax=Tropicimonas isoalkanivorans TaxID=441112 RepID=A0A1I1NXW2_9RHOB|nr:rhodanese-like domain-containing protein [Tropicimonas isoalkanivorans]SFD02377.1 Rhodanese-related sulfurtransferase [Tropicimonas isoalkanivorans]
MEIEKTSEGDLETWTVAEVAKAFRAGEIALIDVRTIQEYAFEHIRGALLLPMPFFEPERLPSQAGKRIVFHCGSGKRSERVARAALKAGFAPVAHMGGGFGAWKAEGEAYMGTDMATGNSVRVPGKNG